MNALTAKYAVLKILEEETKRIEQSGDLAQYLINKEKELNAYRPKAGR